MADSATDRSSPRGTEPAEADGTLPNAQGRKDQTPMSTDTQISEAPSPVSVDTPLTPKRSRWPWAAAAVAVGAVVVVWLMTSGDPATVDSTVADPIERNTAEVTRTDLVSESAYDGTLGRADGEAITAGTSGTITASAAPGETVAFGEAVFEVDGEPVILLEGDVPAWRDVGLVAGATTLPNGAAGTVTAVVTEGETVAQGDVLYEVDGRPVVALYGDTPAYRNLAEDVDEDTDVVQLEQALFDLGYDESASMTIDEDFTSYTESLVELWQEDIGAEVDGVVNLGEVVFIPGPVLVTSVDVLVGDAISPGQAALSIGTDEVSGADVAQLEAALDDAGFSPGAVDDVFTIDTHDAVVAWQDSVGAVADGVVHLGEVVFRATPVRVSNQITDVGTSVQPGGSVVAVTSEDIVVTVDLPAEDQGILAEGMAVTVELPDGTEAPATVTSVSTVATVAQDNTTVFEVEVLLDDASVAAGLDEAPVDVFVVTDSVEDVVAVPVASLLALAEGGYAVEVEDATGVTRLVAVDPGFFADGLVEVSGSGLEPGQLVVVP